MTEMDELAARAAAVLQRTQDGIGTLPARESVKLRPRDWHACEDLLREIARRPSLSPAGVTEEQVEAAAKRIFEHWQFTKPTPTIPSDGVPAWVEGGNSLMQDKARAFARAALEAAAKAHPSLPAGHVAVPVEPTPEMLAEAMREADRRGYQHTKGYINEDDARYLYAAMLAALPHNQGEGEVMDVAKLIEQAKRKASWLDAFEPPVGDLLRELANALETLQREREEAVARAEKAEAELSDTRETFSLFASLPRGEQCNCLAPIIRYDGLGQTCAVCNLPARDDLSPKEAEE